MIRTLLTFLGTFAAGALIALVARAALHEPHATKEAGAVGGGDYAPLVSNTLAPAAKDAAAQPAAAERTLASASNQPVNTVCAICGMDVDPKIPTAQYQGKTIGFGCKMCPPKFAKDPERWGPLYLANQVAPR